MGTHIPAEWMVLCGGVDLRAEAHVLDTGWCPCTTGPVFIDEDRLWSALSHLFLKRGRVPLSLPVVVLVPISL